jgi:uncharacterized protein
MSVIGTVESLWRYPVKSMRGEELDEIFAGYAGVYGDRLFAFKSAASPAGFPYFTGREQRQMLLYKPRFRDAGKAARPINQAEAESLAIGVTPLFADAAELLIDVETPTGETLSLDSPSLIEMLRSGIDQKHELALLRCDRPLTDCRPISIFSVQTVRKLGQEAGIDLDKRRFRANIYLDLKSTVGFAEDEFVGKSLRIGPRSVIRVLERDSRCMMITLDPDTAEKTPAVLKQVAQAHDGKAGVYGAVLIEGIVRKGDPVEVLD